MFFLDCTLRDGGYYNDWDFPRELVEQYLAAMVSARVDIVELGFRSLKNAGFKGAYAYTTDLFLESLPIPDALQTAVMVNANELVGETPLNEALEQLFPRPADDTVLDMVRIACHVHEFPDALPAATWLHQRGFRVGFNLMQVSDRSESEVTELARQAAEFPVDVLYFADSLGSMTPEHTRSIVQWIQQGWPGAIGIHTHDNMNRALENTLAALQAGATWADSTVTGMGRGPGNARTEELAVELSERRPETPSITPLMALIRHQFAPMQRHYRWGTNFYYYLAGKYGIHPTYIQEMLSDARYDDEDILAVIEHLRVEGGKKFSLNTLDAARHFYKGEPVGDWAPVDWMEGKEVFLLGSGPGVRNHREAIEQYIRRARPLVMALNTQSAIAPDLIDVRVACHPVRLLADCETHAELPHPLITPGSMLPDDVLESLGDKHLLDYGLSVQEDTFSFDRYHCTLPTSLVIAYALAVATSGRAQRVLMAGFDGYGGDDPRTREMENLLALYQRHEEALETLSVTPTRYAIPTQSIYAMGAS